MGNGGVTTPFLILALDGDERSDSRPCRFTPRKRAPGTHWIGGWVSPRARLDAVKRKSRTPAGNRTSAVQPVAIPTELSRILDNIYYI
jgi:hypothetical protein